MQSIFLSHIMNMNNNEPQYKAHNARWCFFHSEAKHIVHCTIPHSNTFFSRFALCRTAATVKLWHQGFVVVSKIRRHVADCQLASTLINCDITWKFCSRYLTSSLINIHPCRGKISHTRLMHRKTSRKINIKWSASNIRESIVVVVLSALYTKWSSQRLPSSTFIENCLM